MNAPDDADRRAPVRRAFLDRHRPGAVPQPLRPDASHRRYFRLHGGPRPELLMDCPPGLEDCARFAAVARHLLDLGLSAPRVYELDETAGLALVEDFGERTFTCLLAGGHDESDLYALAADVLAHLHGHDRALALLLPSYDPPAQVEAAMLLAHWYLPLVLDARPGAALCAALHETWRGVLDATAADGEVLQLRDYHVDNAILLPERQGVARCGLLDFQDASRGAAAYDLVSLLQDARRDVSPRLAEQVLARYHAAMPGPEASRLRESYWRLAAQRHARVIGVFCRLCVRDAKPAYLIHLPRLLRLLGEALEYPALRPLRDLLDDSAPRWRQGTDAATAAARRHLTPAGADPVD